MYATYVTSILLGSEQFYSHDVNATKYESISWLYTTLNTTLVLYKHYVI